jgi:hypothetical protein
MNLKMVCLAGSLSMILACGQSEISIPGTQDGAIPDVSLGDTTPVDGPLASDGSAGDQTSEITNDGGKPGDGPAGDLIGLDTSDGGSDECEAGSGCFGEPCNESDDCISGWCVDHMGDPVCTETCETDCPQGWKCKEVQTSGGDVAFLCISDHTHLCRPCIEASGCTSLTGVEDVCVDYGPQGMFCASPCQSSSDCPDGFECQEALGASGGTSSQCVNSTGVCECSEKAINLGLQTTCSVTGDDATCVGVKTCTVEGLSECSVAEPTDEVCNGIDDDCDGETDEGSCDDDDPCTGDSCDGLVCAYELLTGGDCDDESECTQDDHCDTGFCLGKGAYCNDDNPCTQDWCDQQQGCINEASLEACDDADPCTINDTCSLEGCVGEEQPCECLIDLDCAALDDGDACNGTMICDTSALPYACVTDPETVVDCALPDAPNSFCKATWCEPATGTCFTGTNNEGIACDDGDSCTIGEGCSQGQCAGAVPLSCDDASPCTSDTCDSQEGCVFTPVSGPCDDASACTVADTCQGGACVSGPSPDCDDLNPCTADTCDDVQGCMNLATVGFCDDNDLCTTQDKCVGGVCTGTVPFVCEDTNPCTDDICSPEFGCYFPANTAACDDQNPCTIGETCADKTCGNASPLNCDDQNICTQDECVNGFGCNHPPATGPCDDGNPCTENDSCQASACVGIAVVSCDDGDPCTDDICTENLGCEYPLNTAPCEDGDLCSVNDTCAGGVCVPGPPPNCDDGNPCTDEQCTSDEGCASANNTQGCDDNNLCTLVDTCSGGACVGSSPLTCDDQNGCTTDLCDPDEGCLHVLAPGDCDDADPCTVNDSCTGTLCSGDPKDCSDINPCTEDVCEFGICLHPANTADCNDGNPCTTIDYCLNGFCIGTEPLDCDDDNPCTNDSCDHQSGCQNPPNFDLCDDEDPCSTLAKCNNKVCQGLAFMECEDGNPCTNDTCVTGVGCVTTNNDNPCNDNQSCTSNDQCAGGVCTGDQDQNACNDNNPCTTDSCTDQGGCTYELNSEPCDDSDPCTVNDACTVGQCEGEQKVCSSDEACIDSYCDGLGNCVEELESICCGNGEIDPGETCDDGNQNDGDTCPSNCLLGSCPAGSASMHGFCWVMATSLSGVDQSHGQACASIGKSKTGPKVNIPWDSQTLSDVASQLGYSSIGTYNCCAHAMWCSPSSGTCGTHNLGGPFHNYGPYADSSWWPIYTCYP